MQQNTKRYFLPSGQFPSWFRKKLTQQVLSAIERGESGQIIGLPGIGLSSFITQFCSQQIKPECPMVVIDLNTVGPAEIDVIKTQITILVKAKPEKLVVFFESADRLRDPRFLDLITAIAGCRRANIGKITFFFGLNRPLNNTADDSAFKPIWNILGENQFFIPLLTEKESKWFSEITAKQYGITMSATQTADIYCLSGGYMQTIKRLVQGLSKGLTLEDISANPRIDIHLSYHFELILENLTDKNQFISPLFEKYLKGTNVECNATEADLTAAECKLFETLQLNQSQICSRETIIKAVWGEKGWEVNEHALDQLVHRLKEKLIRGKNKYQLQTLRGRGFKLYERNN